MKILKILGKGLLIMLIIAITMLLAGIPYIIFVLLSDCEFVKQMFSKDSTDVLGYYGALIGSGVTILGVNWTLNYESKKSKKEREFERQKEEEERKRERELLKEERRKNSLPILRFAFDTVTFSYSTLQKSEKVKEKDNDGKFFTNYDIFIDTTNGSREYSENSIHQYGNLKIHNIGLGTAIISDIKLTRTTPVKTEVKNIGILKLNQKSVFPKEGIELKMCIRSDDLNKEDTLYFTFVDLYSNKYFYKIPFNWLAEDIAHSKIRIWNEDVEMFPNLVPTEK